MIRPFELRDIPLLHRYRQRGLFLDSIPTLTWGRALVPAGAVVSPISAAMGVFTAYYQDDEKTHEPVIGQITHSNGAPFAHFTYLAPDTAIESPIVSPLLESLIKRVGERGAQSLIAEVDEDSQTFEALRKANFSIFSRQTLWRINDIEIPENTGNDWQKSTPVDEVNIWRLYNAVVPTLVQNVEPSPAGQMNGWVHYQGGELLAFIAMVQGPRGVWLQPFFHPEMEDVGNKLTGLIATLDPKSSRPLFFCLRSYQAWFTSTLETIGAEPGQNQAVMVRRLAVPIKKPVLSPLPQIQQGTEPKTTYFEIPKKTKKNKV